MYTPISPVNYSIAFSCLEFYFCQSDYDSVLLCVILSSPFGLQLYLDRLLNPSLLP